MIIRALAGVLLAVAAMAEAGPEQTVPVIVPQYLEAPPGMETIGDSHGDIAVAPSGDIYVSVEGGDRPGIQIYDADGSYKANVPDAPTDFHGFVITTAGSEEPYILGAQLRGQRIVKLGLDGRLLLQIDASAVPDIYKSDRDGALTLSMTGIAAAPNGDIYAVDGYGRDFIHRFDGNGRYLQTFGGRDAPWGFRQCHKVAIDPRFQPARLLCSDRAHGRIVAMGLDGTVIGTIAEGLKRPSAFSVHGDHLAVAELDGRVTILDKEGHVVATIGENPVATESGTNRVEPSLWQPDRFYAPHGLTYDAAGNLLVTEWSKWGRVSKVLLIEEE